MKTIEVIVPCYNEEKCVSLFYARVKEVFEQLKEYEFIITYVDDGSKDDTLEEIKKVVQTADKGRVQYLSFSRNFGKEAAIYAGLSRSTGDYVTVMDADLQHPPELLAEMLDAIENEGYDCATARRVSRKGEPPIRSAFSKAFYRIISKVTAIELVPGSTDYRLMKRKVVEAIVSMQEYERFTKGLYAWAGYKNKWIEYKNVERAAGKTKWSFWGLLRYAYSGFISFATTPLRGVVYLGILTVLVSLGSAIYIFIGALNNNVAERTGYASIMILMLFLGGVIITILGMIGEYLARIYMEVKRRPIYFERESNILADKEVESNMKEVKNVEKAD
ncbi:MAG: glycosyltransferase family 2 protein [Lachnospiraceae bacterium]|nr:glycosyltransferase family 2 protein [Lachnospiraceae bacterium]